MEIKSAKFVRGIVQDDELLRNDIPKVAFIGRSNVGKSSLINALTKSKISRTSSKPGSTQELNVYMINDEFYLVDLPGYGFARGSKTGKERISNLIEDYLFDKQYVQKKIVMIVDANVGMTDKDIGMYTELKQANKDFIIAASKIDKMNQSERHHKIKEIVDMAHPYSVFPFSSTKGTGLDKLTNEIFG